jgi:hypothetical protein
MAPNAKTNYCEDAALQIVLGAAFSYLEPGVFIGLMTTMPTDTTPGVECDAPSYGGYSRYQVSPSAGIWEWQGSTRQNLVQIDYYVATANWPNPIVGIGLFSRTTGGQLLWYDAFPSPRTVLSGQRISFPVASIKIIET